jgi:hypothetical protein
MMVTFIAERSDECTLLKLCEIFCFVLEENFENLKALLGIAIEMQAANTITVSDHFIDLSYAS